MEIRLFFLTLMLPIVSASADGIDATWVEKKLQDVYRKEFQAQMGNPFKITLHTFNDGKDWINGNFPKTPNENGIFDVSISVHKRTRHQTIHVLSTACHELGHALAKGEMKRDQNPPRATEGEADYFNPSCATQILANSTLAEILELKKNIIIDQDTKSTCSQDFRSALCELVLQSAKDTLHPYGSTLSSSYLFKESAVADDSDFGKHLSHQCRLDIYKASYFKHTRPSCWFKAKKDNSI